MKRAWIVDAVRTPIGRHGGTLASIRPDDLAAHTIRALVERMLEQKAERPCVAVGFGPGMVVETMLLR